jgi:hypothetical protein
MFLKVWCFLVNVLVISSVIDQTAFLVEMQDDSQSPRPEVAHISLERNSFNFLE